jgi:hypothetical protein
MARSTYIYVVCHNTPMNSDPPYVIAAFTVKHELETWMENCDYYKHELTVYRLKDNDRDNLDGYSRANITTIHL